MLCYLMFQDESVFLGIQDLTAAASASRVKALSEWRPGLQLPDALRPCVAHAPLPGSRWRLAAIEDLQSQIFNPIFLYWLLRKS